MGRFIPRTGKQGDNALKDQCGQRAPKARTDELASGGGLAIPRPHLAERQSDVVVDWAARLHVSVRVRALRPKGGCEEMGAKRIPPSRH
jgi:hypothetical protein